MSRPNLAAIALGPVILVICGIPLAIAIAARRGPKSSLSNGEEERRIHDLAMKVCRLYEEQTGGLPELTVAMGRAADTPVWSITAHWSRPVAARHKLEILVVIEIFVREHFPCQVCVTSALDKE